MKQLGLNRSMASALAICMFISSGAVAGEPVHFVSSVDATTLSEKKRTSLGLYMTAGEAAEFVGSNEDALLIDIRTRAEVSFVGMPADADKNIPYMVMDEFWEFDEEKGTYKMEVNSLFAGELDELLSERGLSKDSPIILMCRSGSRSARATDLLASLGYTAVYSVVDGFEGDKAKNGIRNVNGWKNAGLIWSYSIRPDQAY